MYMFNLYVINNSNIDIKIKIRICHFIFKRNISEIKAYGNIFYNFLNMHNRYYAYLTVPFADVKGNSHIFKMAIEHNVLIEIFNEFLKSYLFCFKNIECSKPKHYFFKESVIVITITTITKKAKKLKNKKNISI